MTLVVASPSLVLALVVTLFADIADMILLAVYSIMELPSEHQRRPMIIGAVLLMLAFLISAMIMAFGARFLGISLFRVRMTISISFFIFCFLVIVIYYNLAKKVPEAIQIG